MSAKQKVPHELVTAYWANDIVDGKFVWTHPNATKLFGEHGLVLRDCEITPAKYTAPCSRCRDSFPVEVASRSAVAAIKRSIGWGYWRCPACEVLIQQEREAQRQQDRIARQEQEQREREEARTRRESRRESMALKHGPLFTGEYCPECDDGWLIVRLNSTAMKPFLSCSSYNPYRSGCTYTQSLAPEHHAKYLRIFAERLAVRTGAIQMSQSRDEVSCLG